MGGRALNGKRMNIAEYNTSLEFAMESIRGFYGVNPVVIPYYRNKISFGDVDILVPFNTLKGNHIQEFLEFLGSPEHFMNDGTLSILHDRKQIDFMYVHKDRVETKRNFLAWNDCGMLIGLQAKAMGCKFGDFGLAIYAPDYPLMVLSTDMEIILNFLGLDYRIWNNGFDTMEDVYEFIANGEYFSPYIFQKDRLNARNRARNTKRPNYANFLEYISDLPDGIIPYKYSIDELIAQFPYSNAGVIKNKHESQIANNAIISAKINGKVVMDRLGLEGVELGKAIAKFRKYASEEYLLKASDMEAWRYFMNIYLYL